MSNYVQASLKERNRCAHCIGCNHCPFYKIGQIAGLTSKEVEVFNSAIYTQKAIERGQPIYLVNTSFINTQGNRAINLLKIYQ